MAEPFVGEIQFYGCTFAPRGTALCNGQLLAISQNVALFSLLGTQFGGDGRSTFGLPNFQGIIPIGQGNGTGLTPRIMGETGGQYTVDLTLAQMPSHAHQMAADSETATSTSPSNTIPAVPVTGPRRPNQLYTNVGPVTSAMASGSLSTIGGNQPHDNMQPCLTINFCIALQGIFPQRG